VNGRVSCGFCDEAILIVIETLIWSKTPVFFDAADETHQSLPFLCHVDFSGGSRDGLSSVLICGLLHYPRALSYVCTSLDSYSYALLNEGQSGCLRVAFCGLSCDHVRRHRPLFAVSAVAASLHCRVEGLSAPLSSSSLYLQPLCGLCPSHGSSA